MSRRKRRTDKELFLDKLNVLSEQGQKRVSNKRLRDELNWEQEKYDRVKGKLLEDSSIETGQGPGGTLWPTVVSEKAKKLFISYSHTDTKYKDHLIKHLEPLKKKGLIEHWHDAQIDPGKEFDKEIMANLSTSDVIILMISIDFINSKYCYEEEMELAIERHESSEALVIPVIVRDCLWKLAPFSKIQALPAKAKPISQYNDIDAAFTEIANKIYEILSDPK